jgi:hypothetical protein
MKFPQLNEIVAYVPIVVLADRANLFSNPQSV